MLAIDAVLAGILIANKLGAHHPYTEYMHLLVTYHFGFLKRALIGTVVSLFSDKVSISLVYAIGFSAWAATFVLYLVLFFVSFGKFKDRLLLFTFIVGSPFFFKNFLFSVGYFDIYGCAFAIIALLIPVNVAYPVIITLGCVVLLLIHHLHLFIYIPTIGFIVMIRYYLLSQVTRPKLAIGALSASLIVATFIGVQRANAPVPPEALLGYMRSRALDPFGFELLGIWYSSVDTEMQRTWDVFVRLATRFPIYAGLIALHLPLIRLFRTTFCALEVRRDRILVAAGLCAVTAAYLIMWVVVYDHARHISNWAVCMLLSMHAIMMLPSRLKDGPVAFDTAATRRFAWGVTLVPRVGIVVPF